MMTTIAMRTSFSTIDRSRPDRASNGPIGHNRSAGSTCESVPFARERRPPPCLVPDVHSTAPGSGGIGIRGTTTPRWFDSMIKYLGSKRTLIPTLFDALESVEAEVGPVATLLDLFSGTSRVGHAMKRAGYRVIANDHNAYAATLARCYVQADSEEIATDAARVIDELNALAGRADYFTETFCHRSRYVHPRNGERIDAIREWIAVRDLEPELEAVLLVALMEAADRVDSTTGVQMAYLKAWAPRAERDLQLRLPALLPRARHGKGEAHQFEAATAAARLAADVVYVDPPYNQHSYLGNYHVWESLVRWDKPETYGRAMKRIDVPARRSVFNSRPRFEPALRSLLNALRCKAMIVSFNDEGFLTRGRLEQILQELFDGHARVATIERDHPRYVGARIGIHNPDGVRVGTVSHVRNTEFVFVVTDSRLATRAAQVGE